ncbi:uncharacterized protein LOC124284842 [Haliotis rubra]|uniref:uncharacterized protein LOC124284842 n=1 Tax=Haliotis rubra TaxID=36100 RepID=UPI001EE58F29|nr:uncharacterized protein LOC124284842 [Haliotis rubra]
MEIWVVYLMLGFLHMSDGLLCYQCSSSGSKGECMTGYGTFIRVSNALSSPNSTFVRGGGPTASEVPHYKNCNTFGNRSMCIIEEVRNVFTGDVSSFNRDCSDGVSFSINSTSLSTDTPANFTACAYGNHGYQICITLCNSGNFCNGPNRGAQQENPSVVALTFLLCLFYSCVKF